MPNRLAGEASPYLLQHAHNPVDWYPWGQEALGRARDQDRPIFLSIGYAACHWCHVMERESFADPAVAAVMNEHFVNIKVDREERPDLDHIYMQAVVATTGHGGWPMSVFLTPQGAPFYGGTYFPPVPRDGIPSFSQVLRAIASAWRDRRDEVEQGAAALLDHLRRSVGPPRQAAAGASGTEVLDAACRALERQYDQAHGGWGGAPKFPQPITIEFLLKAYRRTGDRPLLAMAESTLLKMAQGGIYDHLGGGFHRYATDSAWLVPHFEKMLYDNAQLARVYTHAWQITRNPLFRRVAEETLDYLLREMRDPSGGFHSSQDADSEGEEGKFYVWSADEIRRALGNGAALFCEAYGVTDRGNFEGRNILHMVVDAQDLAARRGLPVEEVESTLLTARRALSVRRQSRARPGTDDKVLVAWNGLAIAALAEAAQALGRPDYLGAAEACAAFIAGKMRTAEGRLLRSWRAGRAKINAYLEDHACLAHGLLALYEATAEARWLDEARRLAEVMLTRFRDPEGGFYDTSDDHEALVIRPRDLQDGATPSGSAMATTVMLRLADIAGGGDGSDRDRARYREAAEAALRPMGQAPAAYPTAFAQWLCAMELARGSR